MPDIPVEASVTMQVVREVFESSFAAVYLHGSAASGILRPQSDVDLLVVARRPMSQAMRNRLLAELLRISGRHPARPGGPRCIELIVILQSSVSGTAYPARSEFVYGEWLRDAFVAGKIPAPVADPEITLVLAQARQEAKALAGPPAAELIPRISDDHIRRAMRDSLPALLANLAGDEQNVLLTLARMWRTATTGEFVAKDAAAAWAAPMLPEQVAAVLRRARSGYLAGTGDAWENRHAKARHAAEHMRQRMLAHLRLGRAGG